MGKGAKLDIGSLYQNAKTQLYKDSKISFDDPKPLTWVLPTGSLALDRITGIGGYPGGRIIELYGTESGGKSTLAMSTCVEAQKMNVPFLYIDMEQSLDPDYFAKIGVKGKPNEDGGWLHVTPDTGEDAFAIAEFFIKEGVRLVVFDSVAAMVSRQELSGDYGDANMGSQARMMSQGMRKLTGVIAQHEAIVIFVNQVRQKIGVVYGNPETTTGGNALKFYASIRIAVRVADKTMDLHDSEGKVIGKTANCKTVKNKVAAPLKECQIPLIWGKGVDKISEMLDLCCEEEIIAKNGSRYAYGELNAHGRNAALEIVTKHYDALCEEWKKKTTKKKKQKE